MSVAKNVAYPLKNTPRAERLSRPAIRKRVETLLDQVKLSGLADRMIGELSGGQQQRVAVARALAAGKGTVLFDEPLSNVDAKVREELRAELAQVQASIGFTAVYVTHDQAEAFALADQVAVMRAGRIEQLASPDDVYRRPTTRYVAEFIGRSNVLAGTVNEYSPAHAVVQTGMGPVGATADSARTVGEAVIVMSRPHAWRASRQPLHMDGGNEWQGTVISRVYLGDCDEYEIEVSGVRVTVRVGADTDERFEPLERIWVGIAASDCLVLDND
jgi:iron(III) transport system ATP-binding protein